MLKSVNWFSSSWYNGKIRRIVWVCTFKWWVWLRIRGGIISLRIRQRIVWKIKWIRKRRIRIIIRRKTLEESITHNLYS
jgi:hypothetical protein